jgi:protocatechuate 4,5-dioxygenase, alpha chain
MTQGHELDLPGTYLFDGRTSRRGLRMNQLFMSLRSAANRERFSADEQAYCEEFRLSADQQRAVLERDWEAMAELGGSIFYYYKLAMMDGKSMQYLGGVFSGMSEEQFRAELAAGGRTDV